MKNLYKIITIMLIVLVTVTSIYLHQYFTEFDFSVAENRNFYWVLLMAAICFCAILVGSVLNIALFFIHKSRKAIRNMSAAMECKEQMFSLLSSNANDAFLVYNQNEEKSEYVSQNTEWLLGIPAESLENNPGYLEEILPDTIQVEREELERLNHKDSIRKEFYLTHRVTGACSWFWMDVRCIIMEDQRKYIIMLSQREEEKKQRDQMEQSMAMAEAANCAKSRFLSSISHDIRTPVNVIMGTTSIAKMHIDDREGLENYLEKIWISSRHLKELLDDVLDISQIESGKMVLNKDPFCIPDLLQDMVEIMQPQIQAKSHEFSLEFEALQHKHLIGDTRRLNQLFLNILSNAVKYTPEQGAIHFVAKEMKTGQENIAHLQFVVTDNGIGMSQEFIKNIFHPFTREMISNYSAEGSGLGMSIAKSIVELMEGSIRVESTLGKGSSFYIDLELEIDQKEGESDSGKNITHAGEGYDYSGKRFLLVEDNEMSAEIMSEMLKLKGAEIIIADNGKAAIERMQQHEAGYFTAIFMDVRMPVMDGLEAAKRIRTLKRTDAAEIPIIAMTANAFSEDISSTRNAGMNAHIPKPIDMKQLSDIMIQLT